MYMKGRNQMSNHMGVSSMLMHFANQ